MKFNIFKREKRRKNNKHEYKAVIELIFFVFSMCMVVLFLIFGTLENKNISQNEDREAPVFKEGEIYDIFSFDLLENKKATVECLI